jgi:ATP synthase protein I
MKTLFAVRPAAPGTDARRLLGPAVAAAVVVGVVAVAVAAVAAGSEAVSGALVGAGLVLGFLLVGQVPVAQAARGRRWLGAFLLVVLYLVRVVLLLVAFQLVVRSAGIHRTAVGVTVIVCALAWTAGTVWSALRWRPLVVEPEPATQQVTPDRTGDPR